MKLSIVIITWNEEAKIGDAVKSAAFADEVLVLDSNSADRTVAIARRLGARVEHQEWLGFGKQKQKAVELAHHDWVFVLDADERITPELQSEIQQALARPQCAGYRVARLNYFFGRAIRHGGLYPDYSVRLFDRRRGRFTNAVVHERVVVQGGVGRLTHPMIHLAYETIEQFVAKVNRYATLNPQDNLLKAVFRPAWEFFNLYVLKLGFLDGKTGLVIAAGYSQCTFWKYIK